ncbi:hypothetical protein M434DRAFT_396090 [Hypoxylon sp. CO27-5]|nr:hypothetical protein M434DRAFT_396090 [Hypoxylon sp. CO27-5]
MVPADFSWKRFCIQTLVWSGLLFKLRCDDAWTEEGGTSELGVLGSPTEPVVIVTITTTIAYNPTLAPGDSTYSLVGCYSQENTDSGGGHPFGHGQGWGYDTPPTVPLDKLTIGACVKGCLGLEPLGNAVGHYRYIGLRNGWQCICGPQLVPDARKLSPEDCNTPCNGDLMHLCGGKDAIAVYSLVGDGGPEPSSDISTSAPTGSATSSNNQNDDSQSSMEDEHGSTAVFLTSPLSSTLGESAGAQFKTTGMSESAEVESKSSTSNSAKGTTGASEATKRASASPSSSSNSFTSSSFSDSLGTTMSSSAIGAITGTVSGAIIVTAGIFLCFRVYKRRKQRQETHIAIVVENDKEVRHSRRLIPSAIDTTGIRGFDKNGRALKPGHGRGQEGDDTGIGIATDGTDLIPTTPALESGGRLNPSGLHPRRKSAASPSVESDSLYHTLLQEVRSGPAVQFIVPPTSGPQQSGSSSAVDWRSPVSPSPLTPKTAPLATFDFGFNARNRSSSSLVAHPSPAARPAGTLGDRAWHRRKLSTTFQPPPSRPPSVPLPPTPPRRSQRSIDGVLLSSTPSSTSKPKLGGSYYRGEENGESSRSTRPSTPSKPRDLYALGASANRSLPALGNFAPTPPLKEPSRLPQRKIDSSSRGLEKGTEDGREGGDGEGVTSTLSPTTQGESSVSHLLEGKTYGKKGDKGDSGSSGSSERKEEGKEQGQGKGKEKEDARSSISTVGTSILFPSDDEDGT